MLALIISKELKALIGSPKFAVTFAACTVLILLSTLMGIWSYQDDQAQYLAAQKLNRQEVLEQTWSNLSLSAYRVPDPMQIFTSGVYYDIGRVSQISRETETRLQDSIYSGSTLFAIFRFIDLTFVVTIVLSLFAIVFTYNAVNGEKEQGTLRLAFSNSVPRAQFILGKFIGSWLGLVVPLLIPILLSVLMVMLLGVPLTSQEWMAVAALLGVSLLYFTFFISFGVLISCLTWRSSVSFLISLVSWVFLVLIIPRAGVMLAGQLVTVPTVGQVESLRDGFAKEQWDLYRDTISARWKERNLQTSQMSEQERAAYNVSKMDQWMQADNEARNQVLAAIAEYGRKLTEDRRNRRIQQERLAFTLSRFSPASSYQLACMSLASTDVGLKARAEDSMQDYRERILQLAQRKGGDGSAFGRMIGLSAGADGRTRFKISFSDDSRLTVDPSDVPAYQRPARSIRESAAPAILDVGLLALYSLIAFALAFVAFLRFDVR